MNKVINRSKFRIGFHLNKKYNFVKGLTISEILIYVFSFGINNIIFHNLSFINSYNTLHFS